jgi:transposase
MWAAIQPDTAGQKTHPGRTAEDTRLFIDAISWMLRTGAPWRDLPRSFGKWQTVYKRFSRWTRRGVWNRIADALREKDGHREEIGFLDSTYIRVHQHGAPMLANREEACVGPSRGGKTTKIHVIAGSSDKPFNPILLWCTAGNVADVRSAAQVLPRLGSVANAMVADRAYDSDVFRAILRMDGVEPVIPGRANRTLPIQFCRARYRKRQIVERLFARLKQSRRIATR